MTGTETETKAFMIICIETVEKCSPNDIRTPVFIFERLCSIIYPEENEIGEFYLSLEKDQQQEDFLQVSERIAKKYLLLDYFSNSNFSYRTGCWEIRTVVTSLASAR